MSAYSDIRDIRTFIADQLGIASELVTDELHFADDLECDWLDRLELAIAIEERFGVELTEEQVDRIEVLGDFIRHVENDFGTILPSDPYRPQICLHGWCGTT